MRAPTRASTILAACAVVATLFTPAPAHAASKATPVDSSQGSSPVEQQIAQVQRQAAAGPNAAIPMPLDARLVTYSYDPDYEYPILIRPYTAVNIDFGSEQITGVYMSDPSGRWNYKISKDRHNFFVRAKVDNVLNSGTIKTDKRTYEITIAASSTGPFYKRVRWDDGASQDLEFDTSDGPAHAGAAGPSVGGRTPLTRPADTSDVVDLSKANFDYDIRGDAPFKPDMVFDDGRFTWIHLPPGVQEIPALFRLSADGTAELVNYTPRPQSNYFVAQVLFPDGALLKLGKQEVKVFNRKGKACGFFGCSTKVSNFNVGN
ncbi:TrbG/VirB9 family P-type conjugative transfer protein [Achromobacter aloeverae]